MHKGRRFVDRDGGEQQSCDEQIHVEQRRNGCRERRNTEVRFELLPANRKVVRLSSPADRSSHHHGRALDESLVQTSHAVLHYTNIQIGRAT